MKTGSFFALLAAALLAAPLLARADHNPNFDDDAKPILRQQPHLLDYVRHTFEVRDTGIARIPGNDDRRPQPPYLFNARPRGTHGAYYLTLVIQPGPDGHILRVVDPTQPHGRFAGPSAYRPGPEPSEPAPAPQPSEARQPAESPPAPQMEPQPEPQPQAPISGSPASSSPTMPTAATPSGPILPSGQTSTNLDLSPPPDPAPAN
jgi:hypothetical protein